LNRNQSPRVDTRHKPNTQHALLSRSTKPGKCVKIWSAHWTGQKHCTLPLCAYGYMVTSRIHARPPFPEAEKYHTWGVPEDQIWGEREQGRARDWRESQVLPSSLLWGICGVLQVGGVVKYASPSRETGTHALSAWPGDGRPRMACRPLGFRTSFRWPS
jgi:hypothetical protein